MQETTKMRLHFHQRKAGELTVKQVAMIFATQILAALLFAPAAIADGRPIFWDHAQSHQKPDLSELQRLRFLTTTDFPPFNYADSNGHLAGYNVDLVRNICSLLQISAKCQIQAMPFSELEDALAGGQGEAIIAGLAISPKTRSRFLFTRSYFQFPAWFAARKEKVAILAEESSLVGKRIGVLGGSAHEKMFRAYFPEGSTVTYSRSDWMLDDLREGKLNGVFHDGMRLAFWLGGSNSGKCCAFAKGPYFATDYLGSGLAIAVRKDQGELVDAINYALKTLEGNGKTTELYLRYFPVGFY